MHSIALAIFLAAALATTPESSTRALIAGWSFEKQALGASRVADTPDADIVKAVPVEGHEGTALRFEDWSVKNYLKPNPALATRVVVPVSTKDSDPLNPSFPFRIEAWIYPTAEPIYYGGIVEKGQGYGGSYGLVLHRDLTIGASVGSAHISVRSPKPVSLNHWHEVALIASATALTLSVDGVRVATVALPAGTQVSSRDSLVIGERFTGRIDEVTITRPQVKPGGL